MSRQGIRYAIWMLFTLGVVFFVLGVGMVTLTASLIPAAFLLPVAIVIIVFSALMIRSEKKNPSTS